MNRLIILQHLEIEGPGLFSKIAQERGISIKVVRLDLNQIPPRPRNKDIVLILGGPMSIKDISKRKYPWLEKEVKYIKSLLKEGIGTIGVCLGAQLLAYAAGGDVEKLLGDNPRRFSPEIGWSTIDSKSHNSSDDLCSYLKNPMLVLHWHEDRILLPSEAELIASSDMCKEQLFKLNDKAYGLQFHAEIEEGMIINWINNSKDLIFSALGSEGEKLLKSQTRECTKLDLSKRVIFINKLMDLVTRNKKTPNII